MSQGTDLETQDPPAERTLDPNQPDPKAQEDDDADDVVTTAVEKDGHKFVPLAELLKTRKEGRALKA